MVFLYHQAPKDTRWLVAFLICPSTNPGSFTTNGVRLTVSLLLWIRFCRKELSLFKGDMIYFNVLGQHFLILSSLERTTDLFEKKSSNYSDRPRAPMLVDLYVSDSLHLNLCEKKACFRMKWDFSIGLQPYGIWWRRHRKAFHQYFTIDAVSKYQPIQRREVHAFLRRLLDTPDNFLHHVRQ